MPGTSDDEPERWTVQTADGEQVNFDPEKMGRVEGELLSVWHSARESDG